MESEINYGQALVRGWWLIAVCLVIALGITAIVTARQTPIYQSSGMLVVAPSSVATDTSEIIRSLETLERRTVVATFARVASTPETRAAVADLLDLESRRLRGYRISGSVIPNTNIIRISVEGSDPATVAEVANAAGDVTARESRELYRIYSMRWLAKARTPRSPTFPDPQRNYLVGGTLGLVVGLAAALVLQRARSRRVGAGAP